MFKKVREDEKMSAIGQVDAGAAGNFKTTGTEKTGKTTSANYGNTVGQPQLSEKAAKYYEDLKKKYSDMDFVLVSNDQVENAEQKAAKYANPSRTLVLIDAEKIEKMAEDEDYRKKYEDIIRNAGSRLDQMKQSLGSLVKDVKTFGIKVDDNGNTSFFAVVDKSIAAQKERIDKQSKQKAADRKEKQTKAAEERLEKYREAKKQSVKGPDKTDVETIHASSVEELAKKLEDRFYEGMSDKVQTPGEQQVGTQIDFKL